MDYVFFDLIIYNNFGNINRMNSLSHQTMAWIGNSTLGDPKSTFIK